MKQITRVATGLSHAWRMALILLIFLFAGAAYWFNYGAAEPVAADAAVPTGVVPVRIVKTGLGYRLLRGGKPYFVQGGAGLKYFAELRAAGGNSVRLWSTEYADLLLNEAEQQGLTVTLGLWMQLPQEGFDYYNKQAVSEQLDGLRQLVLRFRRHPAILMWNVGNELDLHNKSANVYPAVEEVARMIHELDPYHPVCTTLTGDLERVAEVQKLCPSIDVIGINTYSRLLTLGPELRAKGWKKPYLVTEFGPRGYWESPLTPWQAPLEQNSTDKAEYVRKRYVQGILKDSAQCLGGYAFFWGQKGEQTLTWFSLFGPGGEKTNTVDALQQLWKGQAPANLAPTIGSLRLAGRRDTDSVRLQGGTYYPAVVAATDPENDHLRSEWEVRAETPPGYTTAIITTMAEPEPNAITQVKGLTAQVRVPTTPGPYRLFVRVYDGQGSVATANLPFYAQPKMQASGRVSPSLR